MDNISIEINLNDDIWDFSIIVNDKEIACGTRDSLDECHQAIKEHLERVKQ